ncbi:type II secretion system protein [Azotobacter chroococcum]|uniref:Type II secretion system protein n=1 Tax=Azotobacter chroococcum TaxID=353 RepID=A0AA43Z3S7_9GAMM|nr:type II secretion system protein [Azotobacter chroococcum]NHN76393.1 type II secretion system protein [Azotobacter chroococcum]TBW07582.1 type II secretion system protein [Azotobacter chroococcum subsp. isscasi]
MKRQAGFTLIELLVVMAIIASLLTIAVPRYFSSLEYSRETTLKQSLAVMRDALDQYYGDTGSYPESLEALVEQRYLRNLPVDPISERSDQWLVLPPPEGIPGGVADVRSGADGRAKDGSLYAEW